MRNLPVLARRDLGAYFHSPSGFLVATLFLTLQGVVMWMLIRVISRPDAPPGAIMEFFFGGTILYWIAVSLLATVLPMRLISEELRTGTIEPLMTAPVTVAEVVLGKWAAAFGFYVALWAPTLLYLVFLRSVDAHLDPGPIAAGYLGTLLVGGAVLAMGLYASALTRSQLVAATLAFVGVFVLLLVGVLEVQVSSAVLAAGLRRISLLRMMEDFGHGIVDSRHVIALSTLTALALLGAMRAVASLRQQGAVTARGAVGRLPGYLSAVLVMAVAVMANYIAGRHFLRGDWTRTGIYTISEKSVEILRALPRRVDAHVFIYASQGHRDFEQTRAIGGMIRETLERFRRHAPSLLAVEFVDLDRSPERAEALRKKHGVSETEMGDGVVVFSSGDRSKYVNRDELVDFDFTGADRRLRGWKGEAAFLGAILKVLEDQKQTVCFTKGHGEPDIESFEDGGYAYLAEELRREALGTRAIERFGGAGVPADCAALIVAEPQQAYEQPEMVALDRYLEGGGKLLLMMGPVFNRDASGFARVGLEAFAERWGAHFGENLVVDVDRASDVEGPSVWAADAAQYGDHPISARLGGRVTFWPRTREVRALGSSTREARELVRSSAKGWGETSLGTIRGDADLVFNETVDVKGPVSVAVAVETEGPGAPARLVFLGTGRLVMNYRLGGVLVRDYNRDLVLSTVAWLLRKEVRVGIGPKTPEHVKLVLEAATVTRAFRLFVLGLPLLGLVLAGVVWYRRRQ